ncbi:MAG: methyltransferase domain-containing protein [Solirubrobacterales bacterium]
MTAPPLTPLATAALHVGRPERILQVQCGEGDGALFLAREFPSARVRGVDSSVVSVRAAAARIGLDPEGRVAFKVGGPRPLPFPDDQFDLVAVLDEAVPVAEVARVLRPGGHLIRAYTERAGAPRGLRDWYLCRRLARRGIEPVRQDEAGAGSFSVARLRGGGAAPRPD